MRALKIARLRFRSVFRGRDVEADLTSELQEHLRLEIERHRSAGLSVGEARVAARREFGNLPLIEERCRDTRRVLWLEDLGRDVLYALRSIRRSPSHTIVMALSLAVGIGANTATFSLVNTLLLRPLRVTHPEQLVELASETPSGPSNISYPLYERMRDHNSTLDGIVAVSSPVIRADDDSGEFAQPLLGRYVSGNFFSVLGVQAERGRLISTDDERAASSEGALAAVISHALWQRKFGGNPSVLGQSLDVAKTPSRIGTVRFTIVGVLPQGFRGLIVGRADDFYVPLASEPMIASASLMRAAGSGWLKVVGRLKTGVSRDQAKADLDLVHSSFVADAALTAGEELGNQLRSRRLSIDSARAGLSGPRREFGQPVLLLMGAVALVLVVACANVINLLLARGVARRAEIGIRLAVGASRGRLVRQLLSESAVVGLIGAGVGLSFALWGTPYIAALMANEDPAVSYDVSPDSVVLGFTLATSMAAALIAGLFPALRLARTEVQSMSVVSTRGAIGGLPIWSRALIVFQMALSLLLLVGSLLLTVTLRNFQTGEFGFDREGVVSMRLEPGRAGYTAERRSAYLRAALERARHVPGVRDAALSLGLPVISAGVDMSFGIDGQPVNPDATVFVNDVSGGYFAATGTQLLLGRDFSPSDTATSTPVVIVNDALVKRYFGGANPVGQRVRTGSRGVAEIVGVVATAKYQSLREDDRPIVYPHTLQGTSSGGLNLVLKVSGDRLAAAVAVRRSLQEIAPVPVTFPVTLSSQIDRTLVEERLIGRVLGIFAALAVVLAATGLYGVLSFSTARRTSEIGLRFALGASKTSALRLVLGESATLALVGIALGVPGALMLTRVLSTVLYGVSPTDLRALGAVVVCLFLVALFAALVPALRAARVNPLVALRYE